MKDYSNHNQLQARKGKRERREAMHRRILAYAAWPLRDKFKGGGPSDSIKTDFGLLGCHSEEFRQRLLENGSSDEK